MQRGVRVHSFKRDLFFFILTVFFVSFLIFTLSDFSSGEISLYILGENAREDSADALSESLGLKRPFALRYLEFLKNFITLKWGKNIQGYEILPLILSRLGVTLELMAMTLLFSLSLSLLISFFSVKKPGGSMDRISTIFSALVFSLPSFSIALILILLFSVLIPLFPPGGFTSIRVSFTENIRALFLPSLTLTLMHTALYAGVLKKSLKRVLKESFIRGAYARGKKKSAVILKDALLPASLPLIALLSSSFSSLVAGSALTETLFFLPGIGSLLVSSALARDTRTAGIIVMLVAFFTSASSLAARALIRAMDPRVRGEKNE